MLKYIPKYITNKAIVLYIMLLVLIPIIWGYPMQWYFLLLGIIQVFGFFYFSNKFSIETRKLSSLEYEKKIFRLSLLIRIIYVVIIYYFYLSHSPVNLPMEFHMADSGHYHDLAYAFAKELRNGNFNISNIIEKCYQGISFSDYGYPTYLGVIYFLTGNSMMIVRLLNAVIDSFTVVFLYKFTKNIVNEEVGRLSACMAMLMPNMVYYCGLHLKETIMLFLIVVFLYETNKLILSKKIKIKALLLIVFIGLICFTFRTVLGVILFVSFLISILLTNNAVITTSKKIGISIITLILIALFLGQQAKDEVDKVWANRATNQSVGMEWRSVRENGNSFAKYVGASVFAPLIFTIPFPTMIEIEGQENQLMIHGGNYVKNIISFFTIFAVFTVFLSKKWRQFILPLSFMLGYLCVLVFSNFAQSGRFHMPIIPCFIMFAAFGIYNFQSKYFKIYNMWILFIFIANLGWTWFKLRGRGL